MRDGTDVLLLAGMATGLVAIALLMGFGRGAGIRAPRYQRSKILLALAVVVLFIIWLVRRAA
jgi:hypothetical protein